MQDDQKVESVTNPQDSSAASAESSTNKFETPQTPDNKFEQTGTGNDYDKYRRDMLRYKSELQELRDQVEADKIEKQKQDGDLEGIINTLKTENDTLKRSSAQKDLNYAKTQIENEIKAVALSKGCKDPDAFYKLIDSSQKQLIELEKGTFKVNSKDVQDLVDASMKKFEHIGLFGAKHVRVVDGAPNSKPEVTQKAKTEEELLQSYISNMYK